MKIKLLRHARQAFRPLLAVFNGDDENMDIKILAEVLKFIVNCASVSNLEFDTSRSYEATGGEAVTGGVTLQGVNVKNVVSGETQWYEFVGAGIGIGGGAPIGGSFSTEDFPSTGSRILAGAASFWGVDFNDLVGAGHIFTLSASVISGQGLSIICFGEPWGDLPLPVLIW